MRKNLLISFFLLGFSSIIAQVIVLREITFSSYGNEFFIGLVLASWLIWVAIGSIVSGKILDKSKKVLLFLLSLEISVGLCLFLEIFLIRYLKSWIGFPGEVPNLVQSFLGALLLPAPLCLILGSWWTSGTRFFSQLHQKFEASATNRAYLWETLGFVLGGILFSLFLFQFQEFLIASILFLLNLGVVIFLISQKKRYFLFKTLGLILFLASVFSLSSPYLDDLNKITAGFRFKGQEILESTNSAYGNITITKIGEQYNFYESALLLGSNEEIQFSEDLIHLSLLQHPSPKKVLLAGGGFQGAIDEILKHDVEEIYYLELDSKLIEVSEDYLLPQTRKNLQNPKVKIVHIDARYFLRETKNKFDIIILNIPDPSTALLNRFYSQEFFKKVKERLNEDGIFITYLTFSPTTPNKNLENLNVSIFKTLKNVFNQVIILPEDLNFFLASDNRNLTYEPKILIERFKERKIETKFLNEDYINYRLTNDRVEKNLTLFEENKEAKQNKDFSPAAYFYQTLFWLDLFYPSFSNLFKNLALSFWWIFAIISAILALLLIKKRERLSKIFPIFSIGAAGFSLMSLEFLIIFSYQVIIGHLYYRIALLIVALMLGMSIGVWLANRGIKKEQDLGKQKFGPKNLLKLHLFLILFSAVLPLIFLFLIENPLLWLAEIILLFLAVIAGLLGGMIFPFANQIYLSFQKEPHKKTGIIYGADLAGSSLGAMLPSLILIPVFGLFQSLLFVVIINLLIILVLFFSKNLSRESI